jgi:hypothetical protein
MDIKKELEFAVGRMIDLIDTAVEEAEEELREARTPVLFDLKAACAYKGITYDSARKVNHLQPLCGYYNHWEDTAQLRKPRWTREQIEPWTRVTQPQRISYVESLLYGDDSEISAGALHMLIADVETGRLPEYLRYVVDSYVRQEAKGVAV